MFKPLTQILTTALLLCVAALPAAAEQDGFVRISDEQTSSTPDGFVPPSPIQQTSFQQVSCNECGTSSCTSNGCGTEACGRTARRCDIGYCDSCDPYSNCKSCRGKGCKTCKGEAGPFKRFLQCKFGFLFPSGCGGKGCPPFGHYGMVYAVDPSYADPRDSQVYGTQGWGTPMAVPMAPTVRHTYNYSWGVPASRITPISVPGPMTY